MAPANIVIVDLAPALPLAGALCRLLDLALGERIEIRKTAIAGSIERSFGPLIRQFAEASVVLVVTARATTQSLLRALELEREHAAAAAASAGRPALIAVLDQSSPSDAAALLRAGVADYILSPVEPAQVLPRVLRFLPALQLPVRRTSPAPTLPEARGLGRLIGRSAVFAAETSKLPPIARCDTGVLIEGETGTGKEMFARAIHEMGPRAALPFVPVNCGAIPVELAESELFGHERGAFTGAFAAHRGLIAQADGGTLFLDEIASLPLLTQVKLLRFLQEKEFRPVGATQPVRANVRVIAAANTKLESAVTKGQFRQDLFYRLNIIHVCLPPLRRRSEDIPGLAAHFLRKHAAHAGSAASELTPAACEKLLRHDWPGNVRELEHVIERAVVFATESEVSAEHILLPEDSSRLSEAASFKSAKARTVAEFERAYIEGLLAVHRGNISRAARRAGKNRRAFFELIRKYGVDAERFRVFEAEPAES